MQKIYLNGKVHRATVTEASVDYMGSITIDRDLMEASGIEPYEKVLIANLTNGSRIESYAIEGQAGSGVIGLNGGAAKHGKIGDLLIIISFAIMTREEADQHQPKTVYVDKENKIITHPELTA